MGNERTPEWPQPRGNAQALRDRTHPKDLPSAPLIVRFPSIGSADVIRLASGGSTRPRASEMQHFREYSYTSGDNSSHDGASLEEPADVTVASSSPKTSCDTGGQRHT